MTEHEQNLRDLAAMFAMAALVINEGQGGPIAATAFELADEFMAARQAEGESGLAAIKPTRKRKEPE